ncbi:MAG: saccharopine dehydrogenase NADP-binding domain-containing protein [Terricaulis sp.]
MTDAREFEVVVYGATGFTGRLVAENLQRTYGDKVKWAMAGRDQAKLDAVKAEIGANVPVIVVNARDGASLEAMAACTKVVLTTVGPYQLYGEPLLAACAKTGTDYVDLCGEPNWMAEMIAKYSHAAKASGARIVFSCGFDSIPFDLGVFYLQQQAKQRFGAPVPRVKGRVRSMKGTFSGGTMASFLATMEATKRDPSLVTTMANPYALAGAQGPAQPNGDAVKHDDNIGWSAPFVMAAINVKNVLRSNALSNYAYGRDFQYDEMITTGDGDAGEKRARAMLKQSNTQNAMMNFGPTRAILRAFVLPKPGQGPTKEQRENGSYDVLFVGETADGRSLRSSVKGDKDPGYASTSRMITESALCLARDVSRDETAGGVWTTAPAMGAKLIDRLQQNAGLRFALEN